MIPQPLYKIPVKLLGDLASSRALEKVLQDAASSRGLALEALDADTLEDILKKDVYRRLQHTVPAVLAKKRVMEVLKELHSVPEPAPLRSTTEVRLVNDPVALLEENAKKFNLYFDWPETQRLRSILGIAKTEGAAGRSVESLVQEGSGLLEQMERRLQEGLVEQAQDLAELKATFGRVQGMGGRDVKRLENLIGQIDEAQEQGTLLPGEVERARNITFKLRKSLESSVVESVTSAQGVPDAVIQAEAQARVQALELEHVTRQLADIQRDHAALLRARPDLNAQNEELRARVSLGSVAVEAVQDWRAALDAAHQDTLAQQRQELAALEAKLDALPDSTAGHEVRVTLDVARLTLQEGSLATDELLELRGTLNVLEHSPELAARIMEHQRELAELERTAREVPGAEEELRRSITEAREVLARGQDAELGPLWAVLERFMGEAAQQRENFDARADHVIREYDSVRSLAGETIQRLGRLAEALRAQRRLGPMSAQARERYALSLTDAEALLAEARAEYQAAQEVTATFGQDALSDLLDVFNLGSEIGGDAGGAGSSTGTGAGSSFLEAAPAMSGAASGGAESGPRAETWLIEDGHLAHGPETATITGLLSLLAQADTLGLHRLDMGDQTHVWSARAAGSRGWRVARALTWDDLDAGAGRWLDTGEA
ncbi:hypothetical protein D3875_12520 [Deinococcus cavernae]|uniref:Uncharacterized protein n=1 Tax=Deinococcus cavernae TaxID=2320857 RepID=A0A418V837_9DEIO|nr:hypothetical protein [Deinococcus cavernae]RJF72254.1 hypothetical protein D3875_12520 [Deinococcus cavernae]